jgi:aminobutyraldehyde dehydrogenase
MSVAQRDYRMLIGGERVDAVTGETEAVINPATGAEIAEVPKGSVVDVDRAVAAAEDAFEAWSEMTPGERALPLLRLADRLEERAAEFTELESLNVGKPIVHAAEEIPFAVDNMRFFAGAARTLEGRAAGEYLSGYTSIIRRDPIGVVGAVAPWNYPLMMAVWKICPAIVTGNTLVLKPSELTPLSTLALAELAADLFPAGVLNVITGHGEPVGAAIAAHPRVRMVSLTGDVATGKEVMRAAAANLKRVHLELGGKAPVIVFDDADVEQVIAAVRLGAYLNAGQDCMAAARVYAGAGVHDEFVEALVSAVETIRVGDPLDEQTELGPVISAPQRDRVAGFVERAIAEGSGRVATGGAKSEAAGFFYQPTVIAEARQDAEIMQREVFGPVVTVTRFASDDEVIRWANGTEYGLAASVFTRDGGRALDAARKLQFGTVWINDHMPIVAEMPHGGFKHSGYGKDLSMYGFEDYTRIKHVMSALD